VLSFHFKENMLHWRKGMERMNPCAGYFEYPFEMNTRNADSNTLARYISCYRLEVFS
jgi:hypothetical protein